MYHFWVSKRIPLGDCSRQKSGVCYNECRCALRQACPWHIRNGAPFVKNSKGSCWNYYNTVTLTLTLTKLSKLNRRNRGVFEAAHTWKHKTKLPGCKWYIPAPCNIHIAGVVRVTYCWGSCWNARVSHQMSSQWRYNKRKNYDFLITWNLTPVTLWHYGEFYRLVIFISLLLSTLIYR